MLMPKERYDVLAVLRIIYVFTETNKLQI